VCKAFAAAEARAAHTSVGPERLWGGLLPDSILVGRDGTARVLDLGVAALWRQSCSGAQHPEVVAYSAPERLEQKQPSANDDVFTLGVLLWEMLSGGKRLFAAASQRAVAEKLRKLRVPPVGADLSSDTVDPATRALLGKMLEPDPTSRLGSMRELQQALEAMDESVARPHELADFVTRFAEHVLDSRERALGRALQRGLEQERRRPASEPPPPAAFTSTEKPVNTEAPGLAAAKPLPLPAQVKLGGRPPGPESHWPPPPPPVAAPTDVDSGTTDDDDAGSVRAEDILAALAVDDLEPVPVPATATPPAPIPATATPPAPIPTAATPPDAEERAVASAPISSGRRAPLTAVVVPSVHAGPDAPTFTPVPSVLQTLRGPGVPPLGSDALAFAATETPAEARAADPAVPAGADLLQVPSAEPATLARPRTLTTKVEHAVHGFARRAGGRLPVSLVAAVGGTAVLLLLALAALGGGRTETAAEQSPQVLAEQSTNLERPATVEQQDPAGPPAHAPDLPTARATSPKQVLGDTASLANAGTAADSAAVAATADSEATARLTAAAVATPRAAAPRPARRVSAAARPTTAATKKKKIRATRTYIPSGI
ncbi:MAG TPA: protein kinase, partial [Polyangiaceae bacterium]|nr:protein kinase [Polyangiaceae bacterium]